MVTTKTGNSTGKPSTAISAGLLVERDAMALIMVRHDEKEKLPSSKPIENCKILCTGLPRKNVNTKADAADKMNISNAW